MRFSIGLLKGFLKDVHMRSTIKAWQGLATSYLNKCSFFRKGEAILGNFQVMFFTLQTFMAGPLALHRFL